MSYNSNGWKSYLNNVFSALFSISTQRYKTMPHFLIVESGTSDKHFYNKVLKQSANKTSVTIESDNICDPYYFLSNIYVVAQYGDFSNVSFYDYHSCSKPNKKILETMPYRYQAVIDVVECYLSNELMRKKMDIYGFIDRDTDGHKQRPKTNMSLTEMHDRETTILRVCLDKYLNSFENKVKIEDVLSNVLAFTYLQGILECVSFEFDDSSIRGLLQRISHSNFNDNLLSLFNDYKKTPVEWVNKYLNSFGSDLYGADKTDYYDFKKTCIKCANDKMSFDMNELIHKWLSYSISDSESKKLDDIFRKTNGHFVVSILINQLSEHLDIKNLANTEENKQEELFLSDVLNKTGKETIRLFLDISPLSNYIKHRLSLSEQSK